MKKRLIPPRKKRASRSRNIKKKLILNSKRDGDLNIEELDFSELLKTVRLENIQNKIDLFKDKQFVEFIQNVYKVEPIIDKHIMNPLLFFTHDHRGKKVVCNTKAEISYKEPKKKYDSSDKGYYLDYEDMDIITAGSNELNIVDKLRVVVFEIKRDYLVENIYFVVFIVNDREYLLDYIYILEQKEEGHLILELGLKVPYYNERPNLSIVLEFFDLDTFGLVDFFYDIDDLLFNMNSILEKENIHLEDKIFSKEQYEKYLNIDDIQFIKKFSKIISEGVKYKAF